ncbi:unnamed protein product [Ilex paraguariensis]|uniref:Syringolide-induced protein 14-1-1 n=1 Tax=Ilex paraguariensis TaxID=185542 RepID=A0ABC8UDB9_9AQUA
MEKQAKSKNNLLKLLPKAASAVTFHNLPFSPGKNKRSEVNANKLKTHVGKGFSGPIISIIPAEARRKSKNSSFSAQEPTSPKISCMGQIKHRNKKIKNKPKEFNPFSSPLEVKNKPSMIKRVSSPAEIKKKASAFRNIFSGPQSAGRKLDVSSESDDHNKSKLPNTAPGLNQMRRFASSRDNFANFDWTSVQIAPEDPNHLNLYSDEEGGESDEEEEVIIPFSAPIILVNKGVTLEPKKEINLWKRRTMAQPTPLQLSTRV